MRRFPTARVATDRRPPPTDVTAPPPPWPGEGHGEAEHSEQWAVSAVDPGYSQGGGEDGMKP